MIERERAICWTNGNQLTANDQVLTVINQVLDQSQIAHSPPRPRIDRGDAFPDRDILSQLCYSSNFRGSCTADHDVVNESAVRYASSRGETSELSLSTHAKESEKECDAQPSAERHPSEAG